MKTKVAVILVIASFALGVRAADSTAMATNLNPRPVFANSMAGRFGAGIILGEPTGISLKYWLNDTLAIDGALGASFNDNDHGDNDSNFYLHADVLWHNFDLLKVSQGRLAPYLGAGALLRFRENDGNQFGIRVPVGMSYLFQNAPVDVFAEIAPAIDMAPHVRGEVTGGVGLRFWF